MFQQPIIKEQRIPEHIITRLRTEATTVTPKQGSTTLIQDIMTLQSVDL